MAAAQECEGVGPGPSPATSSGHHCPGADAVVTETVVEQVLRVWPAGSRSA